MQTKRKWSVIFTCLTGFLFMLSGHTTPLQEQTLQDYIEQHFGTTLALSSQEFSQILWLEKTDSQSPDKVPSASYYPLEKEVIRLLNRLHNLALLREGNEASYQYFTKPQREDNYDRPVLDRQTFDLLSRGFNPKALSEDCYATLRAATIISAVARTRFAHNLAQQVWDSEGLGPVPRDGMEFLWATANHDTTIYPLLDVLPAEQRSLLLAAFLPDSHFRHMLYAEGSRTMFYRLIDSFQHKQADPALSRDTFNFWFMAWLVDVSGFWVNPAIPEGSYYLNKAEAQNIITQWRLLTDALFNQLKWQPRAVTARELLKHYLTYRARALNLPDMPVDDLMVYGGLASLLRIHTLDQAEQLHEAYHRLSTSQQKALREIYTDKLVGYPLKTPTYLPAVFVNLLEAGGSFQHSFELFIDIYVQSMDLIKAKDKSGELQSGKPVSFKALANTAEVIIEMHSVSVKLEGYDILLQTEKNEDSITVEQSTHTRKEVPPVH